MNKLFQFTAVTFIFICAGLAHADEAVPFWSNANPAFLEQLAVPSQTQEETSLPVTVTDQQWRGSRCGAVREGNVVFRDAQTWKLFWEKAIAPYSSRFKKIPEIDFTKELVVGVFRGQKEYPSYEVVITKIENKKSDNGPQVIVTYKYLNHLIGLATPKIEVQPFHLKKIVYSSHPIHFQKINSRER